MTQQTQLQFPNFCLYFGHQTRRTAGRMDGEGVVLAGVPYPPAGRMPAFFHARKKHKKIGK